MMSIYKDLWAWTFALAVAGYPLIGVASSLTHNDSLSVVFRVAVLFLSATCFLFVDPRKGLRFGSVWLFALAGLYLTKLWLDVQYDINGAYDAMVFALVTSMAPAILLAASTTRWFEANTSLALFVVCAVAVAAILWLQYSGSNLLSKDPSDRIFLDKLNQISIGHTAVTALIACYALFQHVEHKPAKIAIGIVAAASLFTVYTAGARGPLMALAVCAVLFQMLRPRFLTAVWGLLICAGGVLMLALTDITPLLDKFNLATMGADRSSSQRLDSVAMSWDLFTEYPWLGYGTQLPFWGYPHNLFMEILQAMGVVGMAIFCVVLVKIYSATSFLARWNLPLLPLLSTQFLVGAQFSGSLYGNSSLWIVATVMIFRANAITRTRRQCHFLTFAV